MLKHRGIPSRLPGTDFQFTIRRANPKGATPLKARQRYPDRRPSDKRADEEFLFAVWAVYGAEPFERGNLDAGRLSWFLGGEIMALDDPFDPESYDATLAIQEDVARASFPGLFERS